ncbi:MAG TPA: hypothetical protein VI141_02010 [Acidimicrobiia bacterium]
METSDNGRRRQLSGLFLISGGALYMVFFAGRFVGLEIGDDLWYLNLTLHAIIIGLLVGGLAMAAISNEKGRTGLLVGATLGFLGLTIGHPLWSAAMVLVAVTIYQLGLRLPAMLLGLGGLGWLWIFLAGVRIGDENGRELTGSEPAVALLSVMAMGVGLVLFGVEQTRVSRPSDRSVKV